MFNISSWNCRNRLSTCPHENHLTSAW